MTEETETEQETEQRRGASNRATQDRQARRKRLRAEMERTPRPVSEGVDPLPPKSGGCGCGK